MPSPTTFQTTQHTSNNDSNKPINSALSSFHHHRPFTIGRRTITTTNNNKNSRPIYGRRSKSYDTRLNAHVTNEERVPLDVKIRHDGGKYNQSPLSSLKKKDRRDERDSSSQKKDGARMRSATTTTTATTGKQHDDLEVCQESLSPDIGAVARGGNDVNNDKVVKAQKSSKRRLSYHDNDNDEWKMSGHEKRENKKVKRRRMRLSDNENIRPNIHDNTNNDEADQEEKDEEENLSFTDSIITHKDLHTSKSSKAQRRRHSTTALTVGASNTATITIRSKANATTGNGNTHIRGSSQIKDLREFAKTNNGTAMQYKATYHTGSKPIHDKTVVGGTKHGGGGGGGVNNHMIQPGQLIIKETSVTSKGNKGGNSYSFDQWKLPGSKRRDSSIYESTRPKLPSSILGGKSGAAAVLSTCAPYLIVDTALSKVDADRVRKFVRDGMVGQTPLEFFATTCDNHDDSDDNHDHDDEEDDDALPFDGSIVSDEDDEVGCKEEVERKVLGDRSNTTMGRKILKGKGE
jgi:hypothetical protein